MKRMGLFLTMIAVSMGLFLSPWIANAATATSITSGAYYSLININSGKALDAAGGNTANGTNVQIWTNNNTNAQKWKVIKNSDGTYKLINVNSGKALDVNNANTVNGTNVQIWTDNGTGAQKWKIIKNNDGTYKLINLNSNKALDVYSANSANGTNVDIWRDNSTVAQKWKLVKTSTQNTSTETAAQLKADRIVAFAESLIGKVHYVFGVNNPSKLIFDCSSYTKYVYASQGINLIWGSAAQSHQGTPIYKKSDLRKGDLVHFSTVTPGKINHVGIYIGNGKFISNTTGSTYGPEIDSITSGWYSDRFVVGTRVIPGL